MNALEKLFDEYEDACAAFDDTRHRSTPWDVWNARLEARNEARAKLKEALKQTEVR
jgi:hypothetical protein